MKFIFLKTNPLAGNIWFEMASLGVSVGVIVLLFLLIFLGLQYYREDVVNILSGFHQTEASTGTKFNTFGWGIPNSKEDLLKEKEKLQLRLSAVDKRLNEIVMSETVVKPVAAPAVTTLPNLQFQPTTLTQSPANSARVPRPGSQFLLRDIDADGDQATANSVSEKSSTEIVKSPASSLRAPDKYSQPRPTPRPSKDLTNTETATKSDPPATIAKSSTSSSCPYDFTVYVYPIPTQLASVRLGEEARRNNSLHICQKCILEQFSLEYIMYDFFTQFCGRTFDPQKADFFYLPLIRDAEYRLTMESGGLHKRAPSPTEQALLDVMEKGSFTKWLELFQVSDTYWKRRNGGDHIIVMPAPVTNLRHESSKRGYFHYMSHLHTPIFVGLEYSASFVREYPICAMQKNIIVPYPTTDPELYNGKLLVAGGEVKRDYLLYYAGGVHGDCVEIRQAMKKVILNSTKLKGVVPDVKSNMAEREHGFRAATFCPIPVGDSPSSKRMYDVMNFGCIPVVLSDDLVWAYDAEHSFGGKLLLNRSKFSIQLPQSVVQFTAQKLLARFKSMPEKFGYLPVGRESLYEILRQANAAGPSAAYRNGIYVNPLVQILERISRANIEYLQRGVTAAAPFYRFYSMNASMTAIPTSQHVFPDGGAMAVFADMLSARKHKGVKEIHDSCKAEKERPGHGYLHRYPCEPNDRRRLMLEYFGAR